MMREMTLKMTDGFSIHAFVLKPDIEPIGHIHLLHGMAEHIARYKEFAEYLAGKGYIVSGHDHRGHGKTAELNGKLGYFTDKYGFDHVVQDVYEIVSTIRVQHPSPRFILFGHSMGSFIARRYIQLYVDEVDKVILSGTGGDPGIMRSAGSAAALISGKMNGFDKPDHFLNKLVFAGFNKQIEKPVTSLDWLSRDAATIELYINDPICGFVPTTRFFVDLFDGLKKINAKEAINNVSKNLPILLFSGSEDPVGANGKGVMSVAKQYDKAGIKDVTVKLFEGGRHEMLNEINRQEVFKTVSDWIEKKK